MIMSGMSGLTRATVSGRVTTDKYVSTSVIPPFLSLLGPLVFFFCREVCVLIYIHIFF